MSRSSTPAARVRRLGWPSPVVAAMLLVACGGGGGGADPQPSPTGRPAATLPSSQPGDLLAYAQARLRARLQATGSTALPAGGGVAPPPLLAATSGDTTERSATTVQEQGIDEDDLVKTDGAAIYTLVRGEGQAPAPSTSLLQVHRRRTDGGLEPPVVLPPPAVDEGAASARGLYLAAGAHRVAVLGEAGGGLFDICPPGLACITILPPEPGDSGPPVVLLDLADVADPARPAHVERLRIDGRLLGSRLIGDSLWLVTQHAPRLAVDRLPAGATFAEREAAIAAVTAADLLPTIRVGAAAPQALHAETDCVVQPGNSSPSIELTSITVIDLASTVLARSSRCFAGGAEAVYMSAANLYLATTRSQWPAGTTTIRYAPTFATDIHKFRLDAGGASYRGSGEVPGHLGWDTARKSYRMSEHGGDLRVLTFTGELGWVGRPALDGPASAQTAPPSPASLSILRERASDASLQVIGRLPNERRPQPIGQAGEQVYAVRFVGDRGYVVTFRQVDPLYVLDLADPADPKTAGELKMPGFSDYLYELDGGLLLGIGKDADDSGRVGGIKLALFDVADAAQPRVLSTRVIGERGSSTALDHTPHGVSFLRQGGVVRVALPLVAVEGAAGAFRHGLQRIEVDTVSRTIGDRGLLAPAVPPLGYPDLSSERSVLVGAQVYYLSQGRLAGADW